MWLDSANIHASSITPDDLINSLSFSDVAWDTSSSTLAWQENRKSGVALVAQTRGENPRDLVRDLRIGGGIGYGGGGFAVGGQVVFVQGNVAHSYTSCLCAVANPAPSPHQLGMLLPPSSPPIIAGC
ncbi:MAG UNVERIFIED_CONTAM: hypothetical protein LVT10_23400 [Anaerolineae bacterium]|jgi:hypothetical protein